MAATALRLENYLRTFSQGSSCLATAGLWAGIPLGFGERRAKERVCYMSYHFPMRIGEYRQGCLLSRPGTLSSIRNGGEGWGEEALIGEATVYHWELVLYHFLMRIGEYRKGASAPASSTLSSTQSGGENSPDGVRA